MFKFRKKKSDIELMQPDQVDEATADDDTPWAKAAAAHEDRILRVQAQVANWRMFAFFCLAIAAAAVAGLIWVALKSKFIPMVFEVDKLGQTVAVKALYGDEAVSDTQRLVYREMFDLIENLRTVTTDRQANNDRLTKGFSRLSGAAERYVRTELRKAPPNEVGATKTVQVIVRSALKLTGKSWQVDWEEHSFSLAGEEMGVERWRATVQYELNPAGDEKAIRRNPIGFTVPELSWQRIVQ
ncbi:type IV secretion system protein [Ralstonia pseudosolanacearum]|jgi:type IV secretion system protein VirB5|uniref:type IV secretion system protein n=1 Tax=Ralstonia pseudosolanacearum TaxID=1310165 RepID=UPI001FF93FFB|nr:type IV secretion system protein [Ralstonia pseudosolanacearum]